MLACHATARIPRNSHPPPPHTVHHVSRASGIATPAPRHPRQRRRRPTRHFHIQPRLVVRPGHSAIRRETAAVSIDHPSTTQPPPGLHAASAQPLSRFAATVASHHTVREHASLHRLTASDRFSSSVLRRVITAAEQPRWRLRGSFAGSFTGSFTGAFTSTPFRQGEYRRSRKSPGGLDLACISRSDQVSW